MGSEAINIRFAKIVSWVFNPFIIPLYGLCVIFFAPTMFAYLPLSVKKLLLLIVGINNILLPLSLIPFFVHRNLIKSYSLGEKDDRNFPLVLSSILFLITAYVMNRFPIPSFIKSYFFALAFISIAVTVINFRWKISVHATGIGVLIALVVILALQMNAPMIYFMMTAVLSAGLVMSSRLRLGMHNPAQVWIGLLAGFAGMLSFMMAVN